MNKNIAVIGCGYWGKNLVRNFHQLGCLAAIVDVNKDISKKFSQECNVQQLSLTQVLNDSEINAVIIALPAEMHFEVTKQALEHKKDVFVEKPLALKVEEANILHILAKQNQCILMVGHLLQFHPAFLRLKEFIKTGKLGRLQYIYSNRLNLGKFRREENILWSFAPHDISMILGLTTEMPHKVNASGANYLHDRLADVTTTHLCFPSGVKAHIFVSWLHPIKEQKLVVIGSKGMAVFDDNQAWNEKLKLYPHQITWLDGIPTPKKAQAVHVELDEIEPLKAECQHFIECIQNRMTPITNSQEAINVLNVLEQAEQALQQAKHINSHTNNEKFKNYFAHETSIVDSGVQIEEDTKIWHFSHILKDTAIGKKCIIGQNVMIGPNVKIGDNCKIQNNVSIYKGVTLEQDVFCGPSCVFTNVINPRAAIERKNKFLPTLVKKGATIGANATIVCGNTIGAFAMVGAGSVVTKDVPNHALVVGVPAKQVGWVSHSGDTLDEKLQCPKTGDKYKVNSDGQLMLNEKKAVHDFS